MEESKELQGFYKIFRAVIYVSILMEFFAYALEPEQLDFLGGVVTDIHGRIKRWMIYHDASAFSGTPKCSRHAFFCSSGASAPGLSLIHI